MHFIYNFNKILSYKSFLYIEAVMILYQYVEFIYKNKFFFPQFGAMHKSCSAAAFLSHKV